MQYMIGISAATKIHSTVHSCLHPCRPTSKYFSDTTTRLCFITLLLEELLVVSGANNIAIHISLSLHICNARRWVRA